MVSGPAAGLAALDAALDDAGLAADLVEYRFYHAARADLLRRLGRWRDASMAYRRALDLAHSEPERTFIAARLRLVERQALDG
jgi:RNA polymerase sigma-70 factor (ECF subfamily)